MPFFGKTTVQADLRLHKQQAGLVTTGTLTPHGLSAVAYSNVCLWPESEMTALGVGGLSQGESLVTAWRQGEAQYPRPDDQWTIASVTYLVVRVNKRHNHDEANGHAIYDCAVVRAP